MEKWKRERVRKTLFEWIFLTFSFLFSLGVCKYCVYNCVFGVFLVVWWFLWVVGPSGSTRRQVGVFERHGCGGEFGRFLHADSEERHQGGCWFSVQRGGCLSGCR